jgi:hypothetical protein
MVDESIHAGPSIPNFKLLRPLFGWTPADTIKCTFKVTTLYARGRVLDALKLHWRSRFLAYNVKRCNEPVGTDTVYTFPQKGSNEL